VQGKEICVELDVCDGIGYVFCAYINTDFPWIILY